MPKVIGQAFRAQGNDVVQKPLPERWVELIRDLNTKELVPTRAREDAVRRQSAQEHISSVRVVFEQTGQAEEVGIFRFDERREREA